MKPIASVTLLLCAVVILGPACVSPGRAPLLADPVRSSPATPLVTGRRLRQEPSKRAAVVAKARQFLDGGPIETGGYRFEPDPVGFVRAAYWAVGIDLFAEAPGADEQGSGMKALYRFAAAADSLHQHEPRPGDLVFFDEQREGGTPYPAGVAVVEKVAPNGTIVVIGAFAQGPQRVAMNLGEPEKENAGDGARLNDVLVGGSRSTAAQLWRCFADPF